MSITVSPNEVRRRRFVPRSLERDGEVRPSASILRAWASVVACTFASASVAVLSRSASGSDSSASDDIALRSARR